MQKDMRKQITEMLGLPVNATRVAIDAKFAEDEHLRRADAVGVPSDFSEAQIDAYIILKERKEQSGDCIDVRFDKFKAAHPNPSLTL